MPAITCTGRDLCKTTVEATVEAEGYIASFAVVAPCSRMASRVWDALDAYGIPSDAPYTVTDHAEA